jgi:hypothetical protein
MAQHKWHKEIKAWADGAEIEFNNFHNKDLWMLDTNPDWYATHGEFRIKPQPKEPQYLYVYEDSNGCSLSLGKGKWETMYGSKYLGKIKLEMNDDLGKIL